MPSLWYLTGHNSRYALKHKTPATIPRPSPMTSQPRNMRGTTTFHGGAQKRLSLHPVANEQRAGRKPDKRGCHHLQLMQYDISPQSAGEDVGGYLTNDVPPSHCLACQAGYRIPVVKGGERSKGMSRAAPVAGNTGYNISASHGALI